MERHRLTLSGLAFFRAEWDTAVTNIYTTKLGTLGLNAGRRRWAETLGGDAGRRRRAGTLRIE